MGLSTNYHKILFLIFYAFQILECNNMRIEEGDHINQKSQDGRMSHLNNVKDVIISYIYLY